MKNYSVNQSVICAGSTVQFTDRSTFGNPTSWQWNFPSGSPNSSTDENPTVTYHYKGNFNVSLTVTNGNGTNTLLQNGYISVKRAKE